MRLVNHIIHRREAAILKTAYHRGGIKRLPTLGALASRGILRQVGRGAYKLARKRRPMGAV
jgi:hypothetical protein